MEVTRRLIDFTTVKKIRFKDETSSVFVQDKQDREEKEHPINEELESKQKIEYGENLKRLIEMANPAILKKDVKKNLPPPELYKEKPYTYWNNFNDFVDVIKRPEKIVFDFFQKELREDMTLQGGGKIKFRKDVSSDKLQEIIKKYVKKYVRCSHCGSWNTESVKVDDLNSLRCLDCNSTKAITD